MRKFLTILLFGLVLAITANAQNPVSWSLKAGKNSAKAGEKISVQVSAAIDGGWYIYSITQGGGGPIPTRIAVAEPFSLAGGIKGPAPQSQLDPNFNIVTEKYKGSANFTVPVAVSAAVSGAQTLNVSVRYQTCNDEVCLPPKTVKLSAPLEIAATAATAATNPANANVAKTPTPTPTPVPTPTPKNANVNVNVNAAQNANSGTNLSSNVNAENTNIAAVIYEQPPANTASAAADESNLANNQNAETAAGGIDKSGTLWSFLWTAMFFGAISLLTPCVFPMIPITVSYFTNHAAQNRAEAVRNAFIYALGIILTFTALGVLLAILFGAAGINKFAANPWINLTIAAVFLAFALSLFGLFHLQLSPKMLGKLDSESHRRSGSIAGLLLMGLTFSLTSFTCTAPFVGSVLVAASQGELIYPILGMLAFSAVFALPFFILALAPQLVSQLPKSGGWMNSVKVVMGLLEVAAALKFLSNADLVWGWGIFTREVVLAGWVAIAVLIVVYILGKFRLSIDSPVESIGAVRLLIAVVFLGLAFYLLTGLFGRRLGELESFLPPPTENGSSQSAGGRGTEDVWITNDYNAALRKAKAENKPVFIDFTGYTCTNCRWMEANMFPKSAIKQLLNKYVLVRLYTDGEGEPYEGFQKMQEAEYGTVALPMYSLLKPTGEKIARFEGLTRDENEFKNFLQKGL